MHITREKVIAFANTHDLLLDIAKPARPWFDWSITVWAPHRKIFAGSGCHCDCRISGEGIGPTSRGIPWDEVYHELQAIVHEGLEACPDARSGPCEYCDTYHELELDMAC